MSDAEKIGLLLAALKPFADAGIVWTPAGVKDNSPFAVAPDEGAITTLYPEQPLNVGMLRKAAQAVKAVTEDA